MQFRLGVLATILCCIAAYRVIDGAATNIARTSAMVGVARSSWIYCAQAASPTARLDEPGQQNPDQLTEWIEQVRRPKCMLLGATRRGTTYLAVFQVEHNTIDVCLKHGRGVPTNTSRNVSVLNDRNESEIDKDVASSIESLTRDITLNGDGVHVVVKSFDGYRVRLRPKHAERLQVKFEVFDAATNSQIAEMSVVCFLTNE